MLNFQELPKDGVALEQLIREIAITSGLRPHWTGTGPDSGRDLLIEEPLTGRIAGGTRLWLVDCKHFAHSGKNVGVSDVVDIKDRCSKVSADGFLLVVTTAPSSELVRKISEISSNTPLKVELWDAVSIERKILTPSTYFIAQNFFPNSANNSKWKLYYTDQEESWMAHYCGYFLYLESRAGNQPLSLFDAELIINQLQKVDVGEGEELRVRRIWHDTPNGPFYNVSADYLVPSHTIPQRSPEMIRLDLQDNCIEGGFVTWDIRLQITLPNSDYYFPDDPLYYREFKKKSIETIFGFADIDDIAHYKEWPSHRGPIIRNFNDQLMWKQTKENFGYKNRGGLEVIELKVT
ncbi:MAG: restriction endonuclease [Asticcacaulis sp.]|uniref:restriction endonuclease n=1 Tax=Asticcacaulis sp. TaxID=1872648 RepID=UPI0025C039E2|nr:restriction endonuclease [Asticcacaulis sp.]MCA1934203.1 restriction endonuclease [Asticcacaulis sp.]